MWLRRALMGDFERLDVAFTGGDPAHPVRGGVMGSYDGANPHSMI
ncbi:MAG TPA: hypothetical protein VK689_14405 [Armatimonadota bacterium]|nr:hypothetical protein [Armatimonadota bacterium]